MIGFLSGQVKTKFVSSLIILTGGVGYEVLVPVSTFNQIKVNDLLELFIYTHVREDALALYGFRAQEELALFKMLLGVSGIGPKTALLVIDKGVKEVKEAIFKADVDFFSLIPRLGRKNSQKIIIELKNKLGSLTDLNLADESQETKEAVEALQNMGYSRPEIINVLRTAPATITSLEDKIRYGLKNIGKKITN